MIPHTIRTRRLPRNRNLVRITSKCRNILAYPAQRKALIEEPDVRLARVCDFF
jgi:hypothetical protein